MEDNRLENSYESKNILTKTYFKTRVWLIIHIAKLRKEDIILDFGCGAGWLEGKLKNYEIYGYDINPEKTFIKDYRKIKPDKIFVLDVFEHIPLDKIKEILMDFKKMNPNFELIASIPTENWISRKVRKCVGKTERVPTHITTLKTILKLLNSELKLVKKISFFGVSYLAKFKNY